MRVASVFLAACLVLTMAFVVVAKDKPYMPPIPGGGRALDCSGAVDITCGETVTGDNTGMPNTVELYSCVGWTESGGEVVYKLELPAPECWIVTVTTDFTYDPDLDVFFLGSCDENDCIDYGDTGFTTECVGPGTYYIVVDGYMGDEGPFTLTVECEECDCPVPPCCPTPYVCKTFDFNEGDQDFRTLFCDGPEGMWEWGQEQEAGLPDVACDGVPVTYLLGTVMNGDYPVSAGEIAVIGPFDITECCYCLELCHWFDTEAYFDGGNVKVSTDGGATWQLVTPADGYPEAATSTGCVCIPGEPAFSGHIVTDFWRSCFDLSEFIGQSIMVGFFFGSDSSITYPGWYIKWVKFGGDQPSATEDTSWGAIKALYR